MASKLVVLALVLFAVLGFAYAAAPATTTPTTATPATPATAAAPAKDVAIGNDGGDDASSPSADDVVAGPLGSTIIGGPSAESPKAAATAVKVSAVVGVAAVVGYFL